MKKIPTCVVLLGALPLSMAIAGYGQTIQVNQSNRTIAVTAIDKAMADADSATVHIGFVQYAPTADEAYSSGSQISNGIMDALHQSGVAEKAIESEGQSLRENMQFEPKDTDVERAQRRFVLTQSWVVKSAAEDAAKVLHIAAQAGANSSGQIDWDLKDRDSLRSQAAAKALAHAHAMAEQMAKGMNVRLGGLIYASNREPEVAVGGEAGGYAGGAVFTLAQKARSLAIRPQKIEESATIYAIFAIE